MNRTPTAATTKLLTTTTRALRLRQPPFIAVNGEANDEDEAFLAAPDPLALEPLSDQEMRELTSPSMSGGNIDLDEQSEGAMEELRKATEAKLPLDPDAAASMTEPTDAHLEVRTRADGRSKRNKRKGHKKAKSS